MRIDNIEPVPLTITDLSVDVEDFAQELRTIYMRFNPTTISRKIGAKYVAHSPIGFTGEIMQFVGNENQTFPLVVFYSVMNAAEFAEAMDARNFCEAIAYPSEAADSIPTNAPPKLLIVWPNNIQMQCRLKSATIRDELYDTEGRILQFTATLDLFEIVEKRMTKESIKLRGPIRGPEVEI